MNNSFEYAHATTGPLLASLLQLAWRNLWRNYRRTLIMVAAISLGVWAMIFMTAIMRGMVDDMLNRGLNQLPGHVQLHHLDFLDDPSVVNSMAEPDNALLNALDSEIIARWYSRIKVPAMIASERDSRGIQLLGITPEAEFDTLMSHIRINEGRFLETNNDTGVVIGQKLAQRLETRLGKRVVITSQDPQNNLSERGMRIVGIYKAELPAQEEVLVYVAKGTTQKLLQIPALVSEVAVFTDDYRDASLAKMSLASAVAEDGAQASVKLWNEVNGFLGSTVDMMDGFVFVWIVVIFIALSFGLANTLVMAIFERVREIGLMLALGMRPAFVMWQILFESVLLLIIGLLVGNALAVLSVIAMGNGLDLSAFSQGLEMSGVGTTLYPLLLLKDMLAANIIVIILGLVTSLLPAWRAAQYDPIRALSKST